MKEGKKLIFISFLLNLPVYLGKKYVLLIAHLN